MLMALRISGGDYGSEKRRALAVSLRKTVGFFNNAVANAIDHAK